MPTNEAGLSEGQDMGDGGRVDASDMPAGEQNDGPSGEKAGQPSGIGQDAQSPGQVSTETEEDGGGI